MHKPRQLVLLAASSLILSLSGCTTDRWAKGDWSGQVVAVADGDTLSVLHKNKRVRIRLHGVDTPETKQPFGPQAKRLTQRLALGQTATVRPVDRDRYGRTVAKVFVGGDELNASLLEAGLAWHYRRYDRSTRYANLEARARAAKRGLWSQPEPTPPWSWRRTKKKTRKRRNSLGPPRCKGQPCAIHGNRRSHVYHRRGCSYFACRHCTVGFDTPGQALAAGYHPHRGCNERPR